MIGGDRVQDMKRTVAHNISELRRAHGMTQLQLAERLNYSDKAVSKWERGDSLPDIVMLKTIADLFGVTVDYLITENHPEDEAAPSEATANEGEVQSLRHRRRTLITSMSILLVWLIATVLCVILFLSLEAHTGALLTLVYAVPVSMIVWLVMNSVWHNRHRNFLIISLLMWSLLAAAYLSILAGGFNFWYIFIFAAPGQAIIVLWSRMGQRSLKRQKNNG